jgi:hypothetical protein
MRAQHHTSCANFGHQTSCAKCLATISVARILGTIQVVRIFWHRTVILADSVILVLDLGYDVTAYKNVTSNLISLISETRCAQCMKARLSDDNTALREQLRFYTSRYWATFTLRMPVALV